MRKARSNNSSKRSNEKRTRHLLRRNRAPKSSVRGSNNDRSRNSGHASGSNNTHSNRRSNSGDNKSSRPNSNSASSKRRRNSKRASRRNSRSSSNNRWRSGNKNSSRTSRSVFKSSNKISVNKRGARDRSNHVPRNRSEISNRRKDVRVAAGSGAIRSRSRIMNKRISGSTVCGRMSAS